MVYKKIFVLIFVLMMGVIGLGPMTGCQSLFVNSTIITLQQLSNHDETIKVEVFVSQKQQLSYRVNVNNKPLVLASHLGIQVDGVDLGKGVQLSLGDVKQINASYQALASPRIVQNSYQQTTFSVRHLASNKIYQVQFRLYQDGVAFRYLVPSNHVQHVDGESSSWQLADNLKAWVFERPNQWKLKSYAGYWLPTNVETLPSISKAGAIHGTPVVFELADNQGFAAITKAALYNYSGMRLKAIGNNTLEANFHEGEQGFDVNGDITTPWRVLMVAKNLNDLATSDLIANLNPAPDLTLFADQHYIKPGRSAWRWPTSKTGNPEQEMQFVDYAKTLGFEYSLVDGKWEDWPTPWLSIQQVVDYAKQKNIGIWSWVHSKVLLNPKNNYQAMRTYFDRIKAAGIVGLKIDFMDGEYKSLIDFEIAALTFAAERGLMVNFHGCHASTGEARTFPNEMTREGIRGIEVNNMKIGPLSARHNAALPFTRFLTGHGDYTPVFYNNPGPTTWAHQLATMVIYDSPVQSIAEHPEILIHHPQAKVGLPLLKAIPTIWDETKVLTDSKIGELAVFARRRGDTWFVAILNGGQAKQYQLELSFLGEGVYQANTLEDDTQAEPVPLAGLTPRSNLKQYTTATPFKAEALEVSKKQPLLIELAKGGGYVAMFSRSGVSLK